MPGLSGGHDTHTHTHRQVPPLWPARKKRNQPDKFVRVVVVVVGETDGKYCERA